MREWSISEQQFTVPDTGFIFQFSSVHSEAVAAGEDAPGHDNALVLRMWNQEQTKCMLLWFDRRGEFVRSELDGGNEMTRPSPPQPDPVRGEQIDDASLRPFPQPGTAAAQPSPHTDMLDYSQAF